MYRIKQFSQKTGISPEAIRYYERRGILPAPTHALNGYRAYTEDDIERLNFVRRARQLDFSLDNIAEILAFRDRHTPPCSYVLDLIESKIAEVQARIRELEQLRDELTILRQAGQRLQQNTSDQSICQILETSAYQ
jgi:MerR family Zn(II)-responsive transcriptional regulator of zntA